MPAPAAPVASSSISEKPSKTSDEPEVKAEPLDPLQMDIDDDDIDYEPEKVAVPVADDVPPDLPDGVELFDVEEALKLADFKMPAPRQVSDDEKGAIVKSSMARIWSSHGGFVAMNDLSLSTARGSSPEDLWMIILVRMITRSVPSDPTSEQQGEPIDLEKIRETLFNYVMTDFPAR